MLNTLQSTVARMVDIINHRNFEYSELSGGAMAITWGLCFLLPVDTQDGTLGIILGTAFILLGFIQLTGIITLRYGLRRCGALAATCVWLFVATQLGSEWRVHLCATALAFAVGSGWGYVRIGRLMPRSRQLAMDTPR